MNRQIRRAQAKEAKKQGFQKIGLQFDNDNNKLVLHFAIPTKQLVLDKQVALDMGRRLLTLADKLKDEEEKSPIIKPNAVETQKFSKQRKEE